MRNNKTVYCNISLPHKTELGWLQKKRVAYGMRFPKKKDYSSTEFSVYKNSHMQQL